MPATGDMTSDLRLGPILSAAADDGPVGESSVLYFQVPDIHHAYDQLRSLGVRVEGLGAGSAHSWAAGGALLRGSVAEAVLVTQP